MAIMSSTTAAKAAPDPSLSMYQLLDPEVLADPYPLYRRMREHDPVHWDAFLHAWVVTDYEGVLTVLHKFSADRTPDANQIKAMGLNTLEPIAVMEREAALEGRHMTMILAPDRKKIAAADKAAAAAKAAGDAAVAAEEDAEIEAAAAAAPVVGEEDHSIEDDAEEQDGED